MPETESHLSELKAILRQSLGSDMASIEAIGGGRNSRVYQVAAGDSQRYVVKVYFRHESDERDRLGVEFSSLSFLWEHGVRCIPRPIAIHWDFGCAVYEYVEGMRIASPDVTADDVAAAVQFLATLTRLSRDHESRKLPCASEACFSALAVVENVEQRLSRLQCVAEQHPVLGEFLDLELVPMMSEIIRWCHTGFERQDLPWEAEIGLSERTLSPSDFGFHNGLRRNRTEIVFLDFEYFGWDDPAKMVSDFLLHPAMELSMGLKRQFVTGILSAHNRDLKKRVEYLYPLFGLKWCLILLNEFLPEHLLRRGLAKGHEVNRTALQFEQLVKARGMLHRLKSEHGRFPYCN